MITLERAREHLDAWLKAEIEVSTSQSYKIGTRSLTRADLGEIRKQVEFWDKKVKELSRKKGKNGRNQVYIAIPRDL